ncbi:MAG: TIGR00725 family protein [Candidatus Eremiobacteraeota bacterium]|nr:TIGR00725 family protein [Candidatus Eremiobacteraeota bacterium]
MEVLDMHYIGVIGDGTADTRSASVAYEVGRFIAQSGAVLVCGGLGGIMEAAAKGAKSAGGTTLGILPGEKREDANQFVDIAVPTGIGEARNSIVVRCSDGLVAVGGRFGTLSEIAFALCFGKPVAGIETWELGKNGVPSAGIMCAHSARDAVESVLKALEKKMAGE